jgi:hypothetical protein
MTTLPHPFVDPSDQAAINLRVSVAPACSSDGSTEVRRTLQLTPGVSLEAGDNCLDARWLNQLPSGYHDQLREWVELGLVELPAGYELPEAPSAHPLSASEANHMRPGSRRWEVAQ